MNAIYSIIFACTEVVHPSRAKFGERGASERGAPWRRRTAPAVLVGCGARSSPRSSLLRSCTWAQPSIEATVSNSGAFAAAALARAAHAQRTGLLAQQVSNACAQGEGCLALPPPLPLPLSHAHATTPRRLLLRQQPLHRRRPRPLQRRHHLNVGPIMRRWNGLALAIRAR